MLSLAVIVGPPLGLSAHVSPKRHLVGGVGVAVCGPIDRFAVLHAVFCDLWGGSHVKTAIILKKCLRGTLDAYGGIRANEAFGDELHGILIRLRREDPLQIPWKGFGMGALGPRFR